tara:strand:+ start:1534 stop:1686 length:153 start_codon:yes stop_codon:yes gene_type:complete
MDDLIRLIKGTLELIGFLINVTVILLAVTPVFLLLILPTYIIDVLTNNLK